MFAEVCKTFCAFQPLPNPSSGCLQRRYSLCLKLRVQEGEVEASTCSREDKKATEVDPKYFFFLAMNCVMIIYEFSTNTLVDNRVG